MDHTAFMAFVDPYKLIKVGDIHFSYTTYMGNYWLEAINKVGSVRGQSFRDSDTIMVVCTRDLSFDYFKYFAYITINLLVRVVAS
jgi:hypothetical protein